MKAEQHIVWAFVISETPEQSPPTLPLDRPAPVERVTNPRLKITMHQPFPPSAPILHREVGQNQNIFERNIQRRIFPYFASFSNFDNTDSDNLNWADLYQPVSSFFDISELFSPSTTIEMNSNRIIKPIQLMSVYLLPLSHFLSLDTTIYSPLSGIISTAKIE